MFYSISIFRLIVSNNSGESQESRGEINSVLAIPRSSFSTVGLKTIQLGEAIKHRSTSLADPPTSVFRCNRRTTTARQDSERSVHPLRLNQVLLHRTRQVGFLFFPVRIRGDDNPFEDAVQNDSPISSLGSGAPLCTVSTRFARKNSVRPP